MNALQRTALAYDTRGWVVLVLPPRSKKPPGTGWQKRHLTPVQLAEILEHGEHNLSLMTGPPSGGLGDVDLDTPQARWLAAHTDWLPPTPAAFGRLSAPRSHRLYLVPDGPDRPPPGSTRHQSKRVGPQTPVVHCELRWGPGLQTVVPGSVHPSGESIVWMSDPADNGTDTFAPARPASWDVPTPAVAAWAGLSRGVGRLAAGSLLARSWPRLEQERCRHHAVNALAGGLVRAGWSAADVVAFLEPVLRLASDEELPDRLGAVEATAATLEAGGMATGWKDLASYLPPNEIDQLKRWLQVPAAPPDPEVQALAAAAPASKGPSASTAAPGPAPASAPTGTARRRIQVEIVGEDIDETTADILAGLKTANTPTPRVFLYGGHLARLVRTVAAPPGAVSPTPGVPAGTLVLEPLVQPDSLLNQLASMLEFVRQDARQLVATTPDLRIVKNLLACPPSRWPVPVLTRAADAPTFTPDGRLLWRDGYDPASGIFVALAPELRGLAHPGAPTDATVGEALALILDDVWGHFPFREGADSANALGASLTPALRPIVAGATPLHAVLSPAAGTGKSLLCRALAYPFAGDRFAEFTPDFEPREAAEFRKQLTTYLGMGLGALILDNVTGKVAGATLEGALTRRTWTDRVLGTHLSATYPIEVAWLLNGNNLDFTFDSARRVVPIRLLPADEDPTLRDDIPEEHKGEAWLRSRRRELVEAHLVLLARWEDRGRPGFGGRLPGSYEGWARLVGGVLGACGVDGFLANVDEFRAQWTPETSDWHDFVAAWWAKFDSQWVTAGQLWSDVAVLGDFFDDVGGRGTDPAKSLGRMLTGQRDRVYAGKRIVRSPTRRHNHWEWSLADPDAP
jgi:hypothetical protein